MTGEHPAPRFELPASMLRDSDYYGDDGPLTPVTLAPVDETEDEW